MSVIRLSDGTERLRTGSVIAFSGDIVYRCSDFNAHVAALRDHIVRSGYRRWIIADDNAYLFLSALTAVLVSGCHALLTANTGAAFLSEISDSETGIFADEEVPGAAHIGEILSGVGGTRDASPVPAFSPDSARITLYSSGSTGRPKAIGKRLTELETETVELAKKWGDHLHGKRFYSTVSHLHVYGLLFNVLLPYTMGIPFQTERIRYPEELETLDDPSPVLVCSPAFLKRLVQISFRKTLFEADAVVFSSGGVLFPEVSSEVEARIGSAPREIYGSTETGGIAYRQSAQNEEWTPFPRVSVRINEQGRIVVESAYITEAEFVTGDIGEITESGTFLLGGRDDSIVKIEEKRISLTEVERRLAANEFVHEASVVAIADGRQYLAAAIVLNDAGRDRFTDTPKRLINAHFREYLADYIESTVIPRKWRFPETLPRNAQDKVPKSEVEALFRKTPSVHAVVVSRSETEAVVEVVVPGESVYFDGHFPMLKVLPGVAQFNIAMDWSIRLFDVSGRVRHISKVKFRAPIPPEKKLLLELKYDDRNASVRFRFLDADSRKMYSTGTCLME